MWFGKKVTQSEIPLRTQVLDILPLRKLLWGSEWGCYKTIDLFFINWNVLAKYSSLLIDLSIKLITIDILQRMLSENDNTQWEDHVVHDLMENVHWSKLLVFHFFSKLKFDLFALDENLKLNGLFISFQCNVTNFLHNLILSQNMICELIVTLFFFAADDWFGLHLCNSEWNSWNLLIRQKMLSHLENFQFHSICFCNYFAFEATQIFWFNLRLDSYNGSVIHFYLSWFWTIIVGWSWHKTLH